jgi:ParB family transcriptional regulator, chromosome partitioning protein
LQLVEKRKLGRGLESLLSQQAIDSLEAKIKLATVLIDDITLNENQPRQRMRDLESLTKSIKDHGVLQPVLVTLKDDGYLLIAGERRLRAAKAAGLKEIPARIIELANEKELMELSLVENIQREDLDAIELAQAYQQLMDSHQLTQSDLAEALGMDRSTIANTLRLLKLCEEVQDLIIAGELSEGHARTLVGLPDEEQISRAKQILDQGLTVRQAEAVVPSKKKVVDKIKTDEDPEIKALSARLMQKYATKVEIQAPDNKGKGKIILEYYSLEELNRLLDLLS